MAVADQTKTLDKKIMQNEAQYDLDRKAAKTSAFSSNNFNKYEYLTGEDLGLMPSTVNQLDLIILRWVNLNKGLKEEGPLKILKNSEFKNEQQLKTIEDQGKKQLTAIKNINTGSKLPKAIASFIRLGLKVKKLIDEIEEQNAIDFEKLLCVKSDGKTHCNLGVFKDPELSHQTFIVRVH